MPNTPAQHSDNCSAGSADFYDNLNLDEFTPSYLEAAPLADNVGQRKDGTFPVWITSGCTKSPCEQYVEWFNGIWHSGDPNGWNSTVFTNLSVMIDPSGRSTGAAQAASNFLLLFKFFPELRGEVISWAANDRELFINWRFRVVKRGSSTPLLVPVIDKFCFVDGRVSFRLAYFDIVTLVGYLSENFGQDRLNDFLWASFWQAQKTGGIWLFPRLVWNFVQGMFIWGESPRQQGLVARAGDGVVNLMWAAVPQAISYKVLRATSLGGPYEQLPDGTLTGKDIAGTRYEDRTVQNGRAYWYWVLPNFEKWMPRSVAPQPETARSASA
jgi:hypothetical protein